MKAGRTWSSRRSASSLSAWCFFSSRRRHTRYWRDWSSDVCSSDLTFAADLDALITRLDLRDVVLAGFSMGGGEVARYLGRYGSDRVAKAMLLGAVPPFLLKTDDNPDGVGQEVFDGMLGAVKKDRIGFLDGFFPNFYNADGGLNEAGNDLIPFSKWIAWGA